jgi:hypothetical protein
MDPFKAISGMKPIVDHELHITVMIMKGPGNEEDPIDIPEVPLHRLNVDCPAFFGSKSAAAKKCFHV